MGRSQPPVAAAPDSTNVAPATTARPDVVAADSGLPARPRQAVSAAIANRGADRLAVALARAVQHRAAVVSRRVAAGILQRQEDEPAGPLNARQVAAAISFYRLQPAKYTFLIVLQLQEAVGVEPTGVVDAATVQAVAVWQQANGTTPPVLKVDGMAGPRTLPRIFEHGLNVEAEGRKFGEQAQGAVIDVWHDLSPEDRARKLVELVNTHLVKAGVPPVGVNPSDTGLDAGTFDSENWQMDVGLKALSIAKPDLKQARAVVDTVYHEARHGEQHFRIAQLRATQLRRAEGPAEDERLETTIAAEVEIPPHVARKAVGEPLPAGSMQALIAQGWFDSIYGPGRAHRERTLKELDAAGEARVKAKERRDENPTPANEAAFERAVVRARKAFAAYRELPEENDAWATGPMTAPGVTKGAPDLPPLPPPTLLVGEPPSDVPTQLDAIQADLEQLLGTPEPA